MRNEDTSGARRYQSFGAFPGERPYVLSLVLVLLFTIVYSILTILRSMGQIEYWDLFFQEDAILENITFFLFIGASALLLITVLKREAPRSYRFFILMLAIVLFVVAMEEISWGQRIFGWESTGWFATANRQQETNLHNGNDSLSHALLWGGTLFIGVLVPLFAYGVKPLGKLAKKLHFPVMSPDLHFFFLLPFVYHYGMYSVPQTIMVTMAALVVLFLLFYSPSMRQYVQRLPPRWGRALPILIVLFGVMLLIMHYSTIGIVGNTQAQEAGELLFGFAFFMFAWTDGEKWKRSGLKRY